MKTSKDSHRFERLGLIDQEIEDVENQGTLQTLQRALPCRLQRRASIELVSFERSVHGEGHRHALRKHESTIDPAIVRTTEETRNLRT